MIVYKKHFLTEVIVKVDFALPISTLKESVPKKINKKILSIFPIFEPKDLIAQKLQISPQKVEASQGISKEWLFYGKEREKLLSLTPTHMAITSFRYASFKDLESNFIGLLDELNKEISDIQINRLGLRYINQVQLNEPNPTAWENYFNENLLSIFNIANDRKAISRAFHNLEINYKDFMLRFQYGMHNPNYPANIKQKIFILDFDGYIQSLLDNSQITNMLPKIHTEIENLFEKSITDKLREKMNGKDI